jgi:hypothetical protein
MQTGQRITYCKFINYIMWRGLRSYPAEDEKKALRRTAVAEHRTFLALPSHRLGALIMGARQRVIYAAPSVSLEVSSALINASQRLGTGMVSVVLDVSEEVFRLGYGVVDALNMLHERKITLRHNAGLRISFLIHERRGVEEAYVKPG